MPTNKGGATAKVAEVSTRAKVFMSPLTPASKSREQAISLPPFLYCKQGHKVPYRDDVKRYICNTCGDIEICSPEQALACEFHNMPGLKMATQTNCWCGRALTREVIITGKVAQVEVVRLTCPSTSHTYFTTEKRSDAKGRAKK